MKKYKKNYAKYLPKVGSTAVVALAMSVALANPANASEIDDTTLLDNNQPPVDGGSELTNSTDTVLEPAAANEATEQANQETLAENQETIQENTETDNENQEAIDSNLENTDGALEDPNLELPEAPEVPNTEGLDTEEQNEVIDGYNKEVDGYNDAANEYNDKVDDYNAAADAADKAAEEAYEEEKKAYDEEKPAHDAAAGAYADYEKALAEYEANKEALEAEYQQKLKEYNDAKTAHDTAAGAYADYEKALAEYEANKEALEAEYQQKLKEYNDAKTAHDTAAGAYADYEKALAEYEANKAQLEAEYQQKLKEYNDAKTAHDTAAGAYADYEKALAEYEANKAQLEAEYQQKLKEYNDAKTAHDTAAGAYADYEKALAEYEANKEALEAEYQQKLKEYNDAKTAHDTAAGAYADYEKALAEYEANKEALEAEYQQKLKEYNDAKEAHKQQDQEHDIYVEVDGYNQIIEGKNDAYTEKNEIMQGNVDVGVVKELEEVGELNKNAINTKVDADTLAVLGTYDSLMDRLNNEETGLLAQAEALKNHPGQKESLGSAEYAEYLAAVEAYNAAVEDFNADVDIYNLAVETYNLAVDDYNANKPTDSTSSAGQTQSTGTADWGNFKDKNLSFNHIDVRYDAAEIKNADTDTNTKYDVEGVYYNEQAGKTNPTEFGIVYTNVWGTEVRYEMVKDDAHDEFGTASTDWKGDIDRTDANANKNTVVTFYATLNDGSSELKDISVRLDANSVYADNSYVKYDSGDHLHEFRDSKNQPLPLVNIDGELYYNVSGQSVFLVSALVCDGYAWRLGGLDLVLNVETMIEIHQSASAQRLGFLGYQMGKTAHAIDPGDPGEFDMDEPEAPKPPQEVKNPGEFDREEPEAPKPPQEVKNPGEFDREEPEAPKPPQEVKNPGEFDMDEPEAPKPPQEVKNPGEFDMDEPEAPKPPQEVKNPGEFDMDEPEAPKPPQEVTDPGQFRDEPVKPTPSTRLEHIGTLEYLGQKLIIVIPEEPVPMDDVPAPVPMMIDGDGLVEIEEEDVPLADAPQTGDISTLFGAISALSAGGFFFLNRKRKDEE